MTDAAKPPTGDSRAVVVILLLLHVQCEMNSENEQRNLYMFLFLHKCDGFIKKVYIDGSMQLSCLLGGVSLHGHYWGHYLSALSHVPAFVS